MISNQILQSTIDGLKAITQVEFRVFDTDGKLLASTTADCDKYNMEVLQFANTSSDCRECDGYQMYKVYEEYQPVYILSASGAGMEAKTMGKVAVFQLQSLLTAYQERFDKDNFFKSLLMDNLLLVDIYNRAKKLHIDTDVRRVIFVVEMPKQKDTNVLEQVRTALCGKTRDFVTAVDERNVIIVKEVRQHEGYSEMENYANELLAYLQEECGLQFHIAYGTIVGDIKEVSKSYKEAKLALDVGKIFFGGKNVVAYNTLGIGRLIYQLPVPLCNMFIREIFEGKSPDDFDEETLATIDKFFENSLNVSETSRQLFIHRNTLVYRLDKIQKTTGLDIRVFEDAITFKIALMVVKYMKYMETVEY